MKQLALVPLAILLVAALVPAAASAKGASEATIEGPGLDRPVRLARQDHRQLVQLAQDSGFFHGVFSQIPDPMLDEQPEGRLGPRFRISWAMPGPDGVIDRIEQDLYPYATPSPVSYMEPGQRYFGTERTRGGWFVAPTGLKNDLVAVGLPRNAPVGGNGSDLPWTVIGVLGATAFVLVLAVAAALHLRRRPGPATA